MNKQHEPLTVTNLKIVLNQLPEQYNQAYIMLVDLDHIKALKLEFLTTEYLRLFLVPDPNLTPLQGDN